MDIASRIGDPILSKDGGMVVAKWKVEMATEGGVTVYVYPDMATAHRLADMPPDARRAATPRIPLRVHVALPDRTYWRLDEDVPLEWLHERSPCFTYPDAATGPGNPRGMVAAIDDLMRHRPGLEAVHWLEYMRGYYESLAAR